MFDSVRSRLTLWHVGVMALVLLIFSAGIYLLLARNLRMRTDASVGAALKAMEHLLAYERAEGDTELEAARNTVAELRYPRMALAVYDADGSLLAETRFGETRGLLPAASGEIRESADYFTIADAAQPAEDRIRIGVQRVTPAAGANSNIVVAAYDLGEVNEELRALRQVFLLAIPLALALSGLSGWFLTRKSMAPVVAMADRAEEIGAANLSKRLPVSNRRDELGRLAVTFNSLLERLELAFSRQRQFMTDASHELRTPLHVIRTAAEVTLDHPHGIERQADEYREALGMINEQARRLTGIVEDMFTLARADAGQRDLEYGIFYLDELLAETARAAAVLAAGKGVEVGIESPGETPFRGDEGLIRQMLLNLLDNAIRHTPSGGRVNVEMAGRDAVCEIRVSDTGSGIPVEARPHIFERFYRADKARARNGSANGTGAGLGLAIARWVVEAHSGALTLVKSDSEGSVFSVILPAGHSVAEPPIR
ncbi:MAG: heavy metal sensor histidine kinase [Acidobacteriota bacterium]|nr:MAG: heavy metal sensor histidine kinase [Acidobacteriota bacterium]